METETLVAARADRVLTMLHLLGEDVAEQFLSSLEGSAQRDLRSRYQGHRAQMPSPRKQAQILDEFERFFQFAVASTPALKVHQPDEEETAGESLEETYQLTGDPLADMEKMNQFQLAAALNEEHPRTVAILLKAVSAKRVAVLLNLLKEDRREPVVRELSRDPKTPEVILRRIAASAVERASSLPASPPAEDDPVQKLVEVLRATEKSKRRQILKTIEEQDAEKASLISQSLYQFDDLSTLDDSQIQKVLAKVDSTSLSTALFGANDLIVARIMNNLSKRARATLQEEMSFRKNVPGVQLKAARDLVVQAIAEADQEQS
ncbi:FliG C-terminal domain-containing protein [Planctomicrobium sp. SH664]|uniref:FliG C-terminal domain-containing protein n=1 Tax=Planctomicrobium sp. SH664 TaxID=3448125 RepID=UPI003F5B03E5